MIGKVIYTKYLTFDEKIALGLFLVLYDEGLDDSTETKYNVTAIKLTSQPPVDKTYSVLLHSSLFYKDTYALCSKVHTFRTFMGEFKILGELDKKDLDSVCIRYLAYEQELERQIC